MDIRVAGHQVETGEALQAHVSERIEAIADKYFVARDRRQRHLRPRARMTISPATSSPRSTRAWC